jgi:hypothetical protein
LRTVPESISPLRACERSDRKFVEKWGENTKSAGKFLKAHLKWRKANSLAFSRNGKGKGTGKEKEVEEQDDEEESGDE